MTSVSTTALEALPVDQLHGVGVRRAAQLDRLGIRTTFDLLLHLPVQYQDRRRISPVSCLQAGVQAQVQGRVEHVQVRTGRRRMLECSLCDDTGSLTLRFFNFSAAQQAALASAASVRCFGTTSIGRAGLEMVHPEYRCLSEHEQPAVVSGLTPVYPATQGLDQRTLRQVCSQALALLGEAGDALERVPATILRREGLPGIAAAIALLHAPPADADPVALLAPEHPARQRLIFEELLAHHLSQRSARSAWQTRRAPILRPDADPLPELRASLPFVLTAGQEEAIAEIVADLSGARPMLRLLQGDVGSGKTVVAAAAARHALAAGYQVALMAPTELLAEQHRQALARLLAPLGGKVELLASKAKGRERGEALSRIEAGEAGFVVGTHALFQKDVVFARLGLVIIDEQHRFGVVQRLALRDKGAQASWVPHQLVMTATPIPRTLAMTAYADLVSSVISEAPPGRLPVHTVAVPDTRREEVVERVHRVCGEGGQVYWVCPLIEESEALQCENAERTALMLRQAMDGVDVGLVHGRVGAAERDAVMQAFTLGQTSLLVATTVVEVGVDVANASLMVIENAERFGLSQLHQLRGRVGRGARQSYCVLMYHAPLAAAARRRIDTMRATTDGFRIAEEDLAMRGAGELLGTRQAGEFRLRVADLARDEGLIPGVRRAGERMLRETPAQVAPLVQRWLGAGDRYAHV